MGKLKFISVILEKYCLVKLVLPISICFNGIANLETYRFIWVIRETYQASAQSRSFSKTGRSSKYVNSFCKKEENISRFDRYIFFLKYTHASKSDYFAVIPNLFYYWVACQGKYSKADHLSQNVLKRSTQK